tara:strand:- start:122 stop:1267 length:1146 start_codon:yes stop_codon:yes gene_type:complete
MSKIKVNSLEGVGASTPAISIDNASGTCTANITNRSNRNKIINGGMIVSQRQTSTTNSQAFVVDRFKAEVTQMDELVQTLEQSSDSPDGFSKSIKITTTTPESSVASNEQFRIQTKLEGQDFQDLAYGTSAAKTITISFYVKASVTGTFGFTVYRNESTPRVITAPYTITTNDWERKTITISGDTVGAAITNDNAERFRLMWGLAAGANFNTASASWGNYSSANLLGGHVTNSLVTTNNATWQLAGVQLEVSDHATDFEHRSFGQELALCYRYYYRESIENTEYFNGLGKADSDGNSVDLNLKFPVTMRTTPTAVEQAGSGTNYLIRGSSTLQCTGVPTYGDATQHSATIRFTRSSHGISTNNVANCGAWGASFLGFSAEL